MFIREPGGPEVLEVRQVPDPEVPTGHVRVAVSHVGVNRADLLQRMGVYPAPKGAVQDIPGLEYAGRIESTGSGVTRWKSGDRVYGLVPAGAYADRVVVHERETAPIPERLTDEQAAAVPEAFVTAYDAMVVQGGLRPGEKVLVHAAGSGVGLAAVQIAGAMGCRVVGTSRTASKLERAKGLGLDVGVEVELVEGRPSFAKRVAEASGGGVDLVLDLVAGHYVAETVKACASKARILVVGLTAGVKADVNLAHVLSKRLTIIGTVLRSRPLEEKIQAAQQLERHIGPWLESATVAPVIERVFSLVEARAAHELLASNATFGKVLLRV